ncbi:MAG: phosphate-selective porin O and P [candidate division Zixibacteria bacterium RBG-1]|nr:MAG: phosphate-selective porin O and P [candidate division Zixibacteria bacterium RBG-1]OGC85239.1 MAG: hypothetical protein A2V73_00845 [candidate division Zixibacteria bacterium RBG_19FT_COMBO_42_43]
MKKVSVFLVIFLTWVFVVYTPAFGQKSKFIVSGYMDWTYSWQKGKAGTFDLFHFNPIFLFQIEDKLLARAEVEYEHGGGEIVLEYAQLDWFLHDYVTISGGKFLVPFGVFNNKLHPSWISKVPGRPLANDQVVPVGWSEAGVMASGGISISGYSKINYALYLVNGLEGAEGDNIRDLRKEGDDRDIINNNKAVGGRLGIVPIKEIEIGASAYSGKYDDVASPKLSLNLYGVDAEFCYKEFLELRGEFNQADQEITDLSAPDSVGFLVKRGYYAQAALKLSPLAVSLLNPVEVVVRFSGQNFPGKAADKREVSPGVNYYVTNTGIIRLFYRLNLEDEAYKVKNNQIILQYAMGF